MMHEVPAMKFDWTISNMNLAGFFRTKERYDKHIAAVAEAWIQGTMPGFRFHEFVSIHGHGAFSSPTVRVRAIHTDSEMFAMAESIRDVFIPFEAFVSEDRMWDRIEREMKRGSVDHGLPGQIQKRLEALRRDASDGVMDGRPMSDWDGGRPPHEINSAMRG